MEIDSLRLATVVNGMKGGPLRSFHLHLYVYSSCTARLYGSNHSWPRLHEGAAQTYASRAQRGLISAFVHGTKLQWFQSSCSSHFRQSRVWNLRNLLEKKSPFRHEFHPDVLDVGLLIWDLRSGFSSPINGNAVCLQVVGGLDIHKKMVVDVWAPLCLLTPPHFLLDGRFLHHLWRSAQDVRQSTHSEWKYSLSFSRAFST